MPLFFWNLQWNGQKPQQNTVVKEISIITDFTNGLMKTFMLNLRVLQFLPVVLCDLLKTNMIRMHSRNIALSKYHISLLIAMIDSFPLYLLFFNAFTNKLLLFHRPLHYIGLHGLQKHNPETRRIYVWQNLVWGLDAFFFFFLSLICPSF